MNTRPESGPMEFQDDWCGVFIRGDNALGFSFALRAVLESLTDEQKADVLGTMSQLNSLLSTLNSCQQHANDHRYDSSRQFMKKFGDCVKYGKI